MNIGILGTGHIGKTLARKLAEAGHDVKVANSRGPETIEADVLAFGARAVSTAQAVEDVDQRNGYKPRPSRTAFLL
ncbi:MULTISPECIES: NAD(P)-binding domain-containing protein [unclassified Microcoleus]